MHLSEDPLEMHVTRSYMLVLRIGDHPRDWPLRKKGYI